MFAPRVSAAQRKSTEKLISKLAPPRSTVATQSLSEPEHTLQRSMGDQVEMRPPALEAAALTGTGPPGQNGLAAYSAAPGSIPGRAWDFSRIPVFAPEFAPGTSNQPQAPSPVGAFPQPGMPPKLRIGHAHDAHETEADRVADHVVRMPDLHPPTAAAGQQPIHNPAAGDGGEKTLRTKGAGGAAARRREAPASVHEVLGTPGKRLDAPARAFFEPRFGRDFANVRIHDDPQAERSAREVGALAYAVGQHVVVDPTRYHPDTTEGRRLLAHELAHVVQQTQGTAPMTVARVSDDPRHQRGHSGEQDTGFQIYRAEDGWIIIEGPSGSSATGHGTTSSGFDAVAYNTRTDQLDIVDNKSNKRPGNVSSATAIDPAKNLLKNLNDLKARLTARQDVQGRVRVLDLLGQTITATTNSVPIPQNVHLVVTGLGGQKSGVSGPLQQRGVEFKTPIAPEVRETLAKLLDMRDRLRNQVNLNSNEHKAQLALINVPSVTGFAGYWTNKLFNSEPPSIVIWGNAFGGLAALDGALRRQDVPGAIVQLVRARQAFLKALKQYTRWKNGIEGAGARMQWAIAGVAVGVVLTFVAAPAVIQALIEFFTTGSAAATGVAATEETTVAVRVAVQGVRVALAEADVALAEDEFAEATSAVEETLKTFQAVAR